MELEWIEKNQDHILSLLKSFNKDNDIIYIANDGVGRLSEKSNDAKFSFTNNSKIGINCQYISHFDDENCNKNGIESHQPLVFGQSVGEPQCYKIYNVRKDVNDVVARKPLDKNKSLYDFFMSFDYELRDNNINLFNQKEKKRNNLFLRIYRRGYSYFKLMIFHEYIHDKIISKDTR